MRCRLERAERLLNRGELTVEEIARRSGFADGSHLARQFRRQLGRSPRGR